MMLTFKSQNPITGFCIHGTARPKRPLRTQLSPRHPGCTQPKTSNFHQHRSPPVSVLVLYRFDRHRQTFVFSFYPSQLYHLQLWLQSHNLSPCNAASIILLYSAVTITPTHISSLLQINIKNDTLCPALSAFQDLTSQNNTNVSMDDGNSHFAPQDPNHNSVPSTSQCQPYRYKRYAFNPLRT